MQGLNETVIGSTRADVPLSTALEDGAMQLDTIVSAQGYKSVPPVKQECTVSIREYAAEECQVLGAMHFVLMFCFHTPPSMCHAHPHT